MNVDHKLPNDVSFNYKNPFTEFPTSPLEMFNKQPITEQQIKEMINTAVKSHLKEFEIRLSIMENRQIQPSFRTSVCPVCRGTGNVVAGFYSLFGGSSSSTFETCRSCNGKGYIII